MIFKFETCLIHLVFIIINYKLDIAFLTSYLCKQVLFLTPQILPHFLNVGNIFIKTQPINQKCYQAYFIVPF